MKKLDDQDLIIAYRVEDMKSDLDCYGGEDLAGSDFNMKELYQRLNKVIDKSDLWNEINECITSFIDEKRDEERGLEAESNRDHDNRGYNQMREQEARYFINQFKIN